MRKDISLMVEQAGVIGAGGAGFPTHVKLNASADTVIINGAECEPLLKVDQQLMAIQAENLLVALALIVEAVGAQKGIVALKAHYHEALQGLNSHIEKFPNLSIHTMGSFYPAGDEQVLVYEVTKRIVPEGGIPLNVNVVVCNVETALNVLNATKGIAVTEKYLTIAGEVKEPKTICVPLGTSVKDAIELAGGATVDSFSVINGGPMMGKVVSLDSVITKTTKGLLVIPTGHSLLNSIAKPVSVSIREAAIACMQCSLCSEVCPRALLGHRISPNKLMRIAGYGSICDATQTPANAFLCCSCRLCEYACVMGLQPWKFNNELKNTLAKNGIKNSLNNQPEQAAPFREYKRYPLKKLMSQLGVLQYDNLAPIQEGCLTFAKVTLPLKQSVGMAPELIVKVGDKVTKGELIATVPEGKLGANLHASISGEIVDIKSDSVTIVS